MDKQVTRKQFLVGALSLVGVVLLSKLPKVVQSSAQKKEVGYGNQAYGGSKKNA